MATASPPRAIRRVLSHEHSIPWTAAAAAEARREEGASSPRRPSAEAPSPDLSEEDDNNAMVGEICSNLELQDIEDLGTERGSLIDGQRVARSQVVPRIRRRAKRVAVGENGLREEEQELNVQSFIPENYKVYLKTWGCAHNNSDSEYMAGLLQTQGYQVVEEEGVADLWLLNSCTVKSPAEDHFRNAVEKGLEQGKRVVVAGCVSQSAPKSVYLQNTSIVGVQQLEKVCDIVEESLKGNVVRMLGKKKEGKRKLAGPSLNLPKIRKNPRIEIIPINSGCLNTCTYCKTKHARGQLASYTVEEIVARAAEAFREGVCEIWLTSEDSGAYGRDIGVSLPELMFAVIPVIPEDCRLRLGMTNPPYILEHLQAMAEVLSHPKIYAFLHIPVQSASDAVLSDMKREYCAQDFKRIVDFLRKKVPGITIATDIICGFPTETDEDFEETVKLVTDYKFPTLFINQFYPRPGTPAAKMRRVYGSTREVKQRTKLLSEIFESYKPYEARIGRKERVLVTEESTCKKYYVGHNNFYEQVLVPKDPLLLGKMVEVQINAIGKHYMMGSPIKGNLFTFEVCKKQFRKTRLLLLLNLNLGTLWLTACCFVLFSSVAIKLSPFN